MSYRHPPFLYDDPIVNNLITMGNDEPTSPPDYYTNFGVDYEFEIEFDQTGMLVLDDMLFVQANVISCYVFIEAKITEYTSGSGLYIRGNDSSQVLNFDKTEVGGVARGWIKSIVSGSYPQIPSSCGFLGKIKIRIGCAFVHPALDPDEAFAYWQTNKQPCRQFFNKYRICGVAKTSSGVVTQIYYDFYKCFLSQSLTITIPNGVRYKMNSTTVEVSDGQPFTYQFATFVEAMLTLYLDDADGNYIPLDRFEGFTVTGSSEDVYPRYPYDDSSTFNELLGFIPYEVQIIEKSSKQIYCMIDPYGMCNMQELKRSTASSFLKGYKTVNYSFSTPVSLLNTLSYLYFNGKSDKGSTFQNITYATVTIYSRTHYTSQVLLGTISSVEQQATLADVSPVTCASGAVLEVSDNKIKRTTQGRIVESDGCTVTISYPSPPASYDGVFTKVSATASYNLYFKEGSNKKNVYGSAGSKTFTYFLPSDTHTLYDNPYSGVINTCEMTLYAVYESYTEYYMN